MQGLGEQDRTALVEVVDVAMTNEGSNIGWKGGGDEPKAACSAGWAAQAHGEPHIPDNYFCRRL